MSESKEKTEYLLAKGGQLKYRFFILTKKKPAHRIPHNLLNGTDNSTNTKETQMMQKKFKTFFLLCHGCFHPGRLSYGSLCCGCLCCGCLCCGCLGCCFHPQHHHHHHHRDRHHHIIFIVQEVIILI